MIKCLGYEYLGRQKKVEVDDYILRKKDVCGCAVRVPLRFTAGRPSTTATFPIGDSVGSIIEQLARTTKTE